MTFSIALIFKKQLLEFEFPYLFTTLYEYDEIHKRGFGNFLSRERCQKPEIRTRKPLITRSLTLANSLQRKLQNGHRAASY